MSPIFTVCHEDRSTIRGRRTEAARRPDKTTLPATSAPIKERRELRPLREKLAVDEGLEERGVMGVGIQTANNFNHV